MRKLKPILHSEAYQNWGLSSDKKTLLVFGGSQGANAINIAILKALGLISSNINVILQTGESDFELVKKKCRAYPNVIVKSFIYDMNSAYQIADLVVCRAGASTISELTIFGLPAILVPYPFAAENHQEYNARSVVNAGAAKMILEKDLDSKLLADMVNELLGDEKLLNSMSQKMSSLQKPYAAKDIVERLLMIINHKTHGKEKA